MLEVLGDLQGLKFRLPQYLDGDKGHVVAAQREVITSHEDM